MSKPLAISSAFSVLAMAAFALFVTPGDNSLRGGALSRNVAGTPIEIEAPATLQLPGLPVLPFIAD